jgi:shikimate kinase / 3-dehydroquinate synthase
MRNLVITGFMGTGKTSVGRSVARRLSLRFVDMDTEIEARAGKSIRRIFEEDGEGAFRRLESALCRELCTHTDLVIATGGGALVDADNRAALMRSGQVICLTIDPTEVLNRVGDDETRPLLNGPDPEGAVRRLMQDREPAYARIPWQIDTMGRSIDDVVDAVLTLAEAEILTVTHPSGAYEIAIGSGLLAYAGGAVRALGLPEGTVVVLVTNDVVGPLYADDVLDSLLNAGLHPSLHILHDGEAHKRLTSVREIYDTCLDADMDRGGAIIALGGGVTGDIAGFAAATYMRGVRFVQIPTSLLAMTDASVGGKTGVDLPQGKNLVGAFKQPERVLIDTSVLHTLPEVEFRSGMAEVIKHGILGDRVLFEALANGPPGGTLTLAPHLLARSIGVKIEVVEEDPFEGGRRAVLNLGHTAGHALERISGFTLRHGEAVSIGLGVAARIADRLGCTETGLVERIVAVLRAWDLPVRCPSYPASSILGAMTHDKKKRRGRLRWILPLAIGEVILADDISQAVVEEILIEMGARRDDE